MHDHGLPGSLNDFVKQSHGRDKLLCRGQALESICGLAGSEGTCHDSARSVPIATILEKILKASGIGLAPCRSPVIAHGYGERCQKMPNRRVLRRISAAGCGTDATRF
jgi:hypothetical protein